MLKPLMGLTALQQERFLRKCTEGRGTGSFWKGTGVYIIMIEIIKRKEKKARKPHKCCYCGEIIKRGETYDWSKQICDGQFYEWSCHLSCSRVASSIWDYVEPDDGMSDHDFMDGCQEVCRTFICPDCQHYDKEYKDCDKDEAFCIDEMDEFFKTNVLYCAGRKGYAHIWKCRKKERSKRI